MLLMQLKEQEVPYKISPAIDGFEEFSRKDVLFYAGKNKRKKLEFPLSSLALLDTNRGEYQRIRHERLRFGCYLSHVRLWKHLIDTGLPYLMVFEDDVVLEADFTASLRHSVLSLPVSWDIFYLSSCYTKLGAFVRHDVRQVKRALCTHGYVISSKGAQKIMQKAALHSEKPIDHMLDEAIYTSQILAFHADPPLISVRAVQSTLGYA